jgi:hypothetical protein
MERKEYKYNEMFSESTNKNMEKFHNMYEDCRLIMGSQAHIDNVFGVKTQEPKTNQLEELSKYAEQFKEEECRGTLRTMLVILKPYKNREETCEIAETLANKLREGSKTGKI